MSENPATVSWSLSPSRAEHVDQVCDAFEAAWKAARSAGERPQIEQHWRDTPAPERSALLYELLVLELTYRGRAGEKPVPEEYQARFPQDAELVHQAFGKAVAFGAPALQPAVANARTTNLPPTEPTPEPVTLDWPTIPGYEILAKLDPGGMGVVYKARQTKLNRLVALKMIRTGEYAGEREVARFQLEAKAVARLQHPTIVQIYDFGEHNGLPYFSMEFADGGSLTKKLEFAALPSQQAAELVETLARAMHYVHQQGIVHRDLKPANVLLMADGTPKIADFGLVKHLEENLGLTMTKTVMGTASYMAPEQAAGKTREISPAADIYALGAILYELLTGEPPFCEETRELTLMKVLSEEPVPPTHLDPEVPRALEAICLKCLEKEGANRYASAEALADDLHCFLAGKPISIRTIDELEWHARWAKRAGYEILDLLRVTRTGFIYKARQVSLNRLVTLQVAPGLGWDVEILLVKGQVAARLSHPNILQIYDAGVDNDVLHISWEFVDGRSLAERLTGTPWPVQQAAELVETLAQAFQFAHDGGVIHGHLRPNSVLLTTAGVPKITAFGLANVLKQLSRRLKQKADRSGKKSATLWLSNYMAPEQAEGEIGYISPATDVYALGAILYEMLTGRAPVVADTVQETLEQIRFQQPVPPSRLQPEVPRDLDAICLKCLQKEPGSRYASAEALAEDLRRFLEGKPIRARPISAWERLVKWLKRRLRRPTEKGQG